MSNLSSQKSGSRIRLETRTTHTYQPLQWRNQDLEPDFKGGFVFYQEVLITLFNFVDSYIIIIM